MESTMKDSFDEKLERLRKQQEIQGMESALTRARSIMVGTCFGGTTELSMRNDGGHMWCPMQPVEVVELIHQLAANIGCNVALKPREDFASWRVWNLTPEEYKHLNGQPPFVNDMMPFNQLGAAGVDKNVIQNLLVDGANGKNGGVGGDPNAINTSVCGMSPDETAIYKSLDDVEDQIKFVHELERRRHETVATKKPANKRTSKRSAAAS
jgi:hypothetical protein